MLPFFKQLVDSNLDFFDLAACRQLSADCVWLVNDYYKTSDKSDYKLKNMKQLVDIILACFSEASSRRCVRACPYRCLVRLACLHQF